MMIDDGRRTTDDGHEGQVSLGGKVYVLRRKTLRRASEMRKLVGERLDPAIRLISGAGSVQLRDVQATGAFVEQAKGLLIESVDVLFDLICEYEATIAADREYLLDHAYDQEVMEAAVEMLKLLFPFGGLISSLNGLAESTISKS